MNDNVNDVYDLMTFNDNGHPTYMAKSLNDLMYKGANFVIGQGAIDEYGQKALYCANYRELYFGEGLNKKSK